MSRKIKLKDGKIENFWIKGTRNPCNCGSNLFHKTDTGSKIICVCNACGKDIYEQKDYEPFEEYTNNSI